MKINAINTHTIRNENKKNVSFKAGKIELYSDFDKTYFPASQSELKEMSPLTHSGFTEYCAKFRNFLNNTKDSLNFHITTGRTFGEYQTISELIKDRGFELPLPDTFIAKNGSDEYIKIGTDKDFYEKGVFPFNYDKTNVEKERKLKELTGWDGPKIKEKLKEIFKEHDFRIVEGDSEHSVTDYGLKSLFTLGKLPYENDKTFQGTDKADWVVGLRNDGNCKIFVTYPPDMDTVPERKDVLDKINRKIAEYKRSISANKVHSYIPKKRARDCGGRLCYIMEPNVDEKLLKRTEKISEQGLTKLYDTKEAVKNAIKNNDLVIVAGDSSNDLNMLNPLQYIDISTSCSDDNLVRLWDNFVKNPNQFMKFLDEKNLAHQELIKQINDLPFMGIIVKGKNSKLENLSTAFGENSRFHKIVTVENGHLEDGIKEAVKIYCEQNPEYAKKLTPDLKKEIFGKIENSSRSFNKKYLLIGTAVLGIILATILCIKKLTNPKKQLHNTANAMPLEVNTPKCFAEISKF